MSPVLNTKQLPFLYVDIATISENFSHNIVSKAMPELRETRMARAHQLPNNVTHYKRYVH